jgi:hypothetical protein
MQTDEANLQMAVIPQSFLKEMKEGLEEVKKILLKKSEDEINSQWIDSISARKLLGISAKTWPEYRNRRIIPFSQFGSKIYVRRADLETFMAKNYISAR